MKTGETVGGIPFTRGPLAHLLRNRFYIGEVAFKGEILAGEQPAIVDRDLFEAVQAKLTEQVTSHEQSRTRSEALLLGRIYDDRGHRMTPSHVRKRGIKYRYYISSALLQGRPKQAGTVSRVPAKEVEDLVAKAVRDHFKEPAEIADAVLIHKHVVRTEIHPDQIFIELTVAKAANSKRKQNGHNVIEVPWRKTSPTRRREVLVPETGRPQDARPIRSENRALLIASIAQGRRWLNEIMTNPDYQSREYRGTRGLQRTAGQHDDLARLPRARPRQGRNRRASPARPWRDADARPARRVASPKADARSQISVRRYDPHFPMRRPGTANSSHKTTRQKSRLGRNWSPQRQNLSGEARQLRAICKYPGNLAVRKNAWWRTQSLSNPSSIPNFPANREKTGNFAISGSIAHQMAPRAQ